MKFVTLFCALAVCSQAGEYAVLSSGFRVHVESHETSGNLILLHTHDGAIELPAASVVDFEAEEMMPVAAKSVAAAVPAVPPVSQPLTTKELVTQAAKLAGLPPALVHSVARAESAYQTKAVSNKGAIGIMQLMPGTAAALHADPHDPKQNAEAGAMYLRELLLKYDGTVSKALAAYNAGPGAVDKYRGVPPYRETINYVNRVIQQYEKNQASQ